MLLSLVTALPLLLSQPADSHAAKSHHIGSEHYALHMSIRATVSGRKFLLFGFKGMLLAEANLLLVAHMDKDATLGMRLEAVQAPNYVLMTTNRKANEIVAKSVADTIQEGVTAGNDAIASWEDQYPDWASDVPEQKRKSLPFIVQSKGEDSFVIAYQKGIVTDRSSELLPFYAWPSKDSIHLTIFDGLQAALGLFNHSPLPENAEEQSYDRTFHVAPMLRDLCVTILPQARSEVEFVEPKPLTTSYDCDVEKHPPVLRCTTEAMPEMPIEKNFILKSYSREAVFTGKDRKLERDCITIELSGKKGNSALIVLEIRRSKAHPTPEAEEPGRQ